MTATLKAMLAVSFLFNKNTISFNIYKPTTDKSKEASDFFPALLVHFAALRKKRFPRDGAGRKQHGEAARSHDRPSRERKRQLQRRFFLPV